MESVSVNRQKIDGEEGNKGGGKGEGDKTNSVIQALLLASLYLTL